MGINFYEKETKTYTAPDGVKDIAPFRRDAEATAIEEGTTIKFSYEGGRGSFDIDPKILLNGISKKANVTSQQKSQYVKI
jgi:hypothetical protein